MGIVNLSALKVSCRVVGNFVRKLNKMKNEGFRRTNLVQKTHRLGDNQDYVSLTESFVLHLVSINGLLNKKEK